MTCVAVMVVPLVVPSTRTGSPAVTALAEFGLVPFSYVVEDSSSMVTFWPADVVRVKLEPDTLPTVPAAPPAAGPERHSILRRRIRLRGHCGERLSCCWKRLSRCCPLR